MAKVTYSDKVALNVNPEIADINKVKDTDMNEIKNAINSNETKILIAVSDTEPTECSTGDLYFNTNDNLIYEATGTDTWSSTGVAPTENTIYILFGNQTAYAYDGTTLVSVGGGSGDLIMVNEEPTEDTKLYIEDEDLEPQGLEIANEYNNANNMAYSCDYVNNLIHISEKGRVYTNQFTNFSFGSETFAHKDITFTKEYTNPPLVLAQLVSTTGRTLYGNIPAYVRSITKTSADLVITYNTNNTTTWVDYIVISMD